MWKLLNSAWNSFLNSEEVSINRCISLYLCLFIPSLFPVSLYISVLLNVFCLSNNNSVSNAIFISHLPVTVFRVGFEETIHIHTGVTSAAITNPATANKKVKIQTVRHAFLPWSAMCEHWSDKSLFVPKMCKNQWVCN